MPIASDKINISDIFVTIQGEGKYLGHPAIFIRTSGCNLRCQWQTNPCDTPYTSWQAEANFLSVDNALAMVLALQARHPVIDLIIITGGEPLLQPALKELLCALHQHDFTLMLETNGTIAHYLPFDFVTLSPKLASSTPLNTPYTELHQQVRYHPEALRFWCKNYPHQFKFVIDNENDESEILQILADLHAHNDPDIYLMPQGITPETLANNGKKCLAMCFKHGWKYTPRAHIELFGNQRRT